MEDRRRSNRAEKLLLTRSRQLPPWLRASCSGAISTSACVTGFGCRPILFPVAWSPCYPRAIQLPLTASPCGRLSRPRSTISQSDFHPVIEPFSPCGLGGLYRLAPEPNGSPLFTSNSLVACWRYEPREHLRTLALACSAILPSPSRGQGRLLRSRSISGLIPVH